jgi:hypothetical protein
MLLGQWYQSTSRTPFAAFNRLQAALMRRFLARGGTLEVWMARLAPAFRRRYEWICQQAEPMPVNVGPSESRTIGQ